MTDRLKGKLAFVTAAGQGIGAAIAEAFLAEGAGVIATDLAEAGIQADNAWREQTDQFRTDITPVVQKKYDDEVAKNPTFTFNDYLDMRSVPRFAYRSPGLLERIELVLPRCGILILYNLLFLAGAWVSFLKYDVR